jgi:hypothetical protein
MKANVLEKTVPFEFEGRTYNLKSTFYVEAAMYDRFKGGLLQVYKGENVICDLLYILSLLVNEAVGFHNETCDPGDRWEEIDERYLGRHLPREDLPKMMQVVSDVFTESRPEDDGRELTDEEKNGSASKQD